MNGILVIVIYALMMIGIILLFTKRPADTVDFHVANRRIGTFASAMSIAATWVWAPAMFVSTERAYVTGTPGLFWFLLPNVVCLILFIPFAKLIRKKMPQGITLSGYMSHHYQSNKVKGVYLFQLSALAIFSTSVQLLAGGKVLSMLTGLPFSLTTMLMAVIAYSYSWFSGLRASVTTDIFQLVMIFGICAVFVSWALIGGGVQDLIRGLAGASGEYSSLTNEKGLEVFLAFGLSTAIGLTSGPFGDQTFWQRAFAIREDGIGRAFGLGALLFGLVPLCMGIIGFVAAGSGFTAADTSIVNLEFIMHRFPAWTIVPFVFMLMSVLLSSVNSNLCAVASLTTDITKSADIKHGRIAMIISLLLGIGVANIPGLTVTQLFLFYGTLRATTLLPTVLTLGGMKLTANGVVKGIIAALGIALPIFAYGTFRNISAFKVAGSLTAVLLSGIVAIFVTKWEARHVR